MSLAMVLELRRRWRAERDGSVRVVVLRGAGGHFCAGGDIKDMAARARMRLADDPTRWPQSTPPSATCAWPMRTPPLAVVAVLEGTVMGGGFGLACVADVALAGDERGVPPARDLAGRGAGADRALPGRTAGLRRSQAPGRDRRQGRRAGSPAPAPGARGAWPTPKRWSTRCSACWPTSCAARRARWRPPSADRQGALHSPASLVHGSGRGLSRRRAGPEGRRARAHSCRNEGMTAFMQKRKAKWVPQ
jgi:isohexenylglutaconyl-CoA hydratase